MFSLTRGFVIANLDDALDLDCVDYILALLDLVANNLYDLWLSLMVALAVWVEQSIIRASICFLGFDHHHRQHFHGLQQRRRDDDSYSRFNLQGLTSVACRSRT